MSRVYAIYPHTRTSIMMFTVFACLSGVAVVTLNTPCRNELEKFMKLRSI